MKMSESLAALLAFAAAVELPAMDFSKFSDLEFAERYAYSTNRTALIGELKRETEPWYFYSLLNLQVEGRPEAAKAFLNQTRASESDAWNALRLRQEFLEWTAAQGKPRTGGRTPDEFLAWELSCCGLKEPHCTREVAAPPNTHPSVLDPEKVSFAAFSSRFAQTGRYYADRYDFLPPLRGMDRLEYLFSTRNRPRQPNEPNLLDALMKEFGRDKNRYSSCGATSNLTIDQLNELRRRGVVVNNAFIDDMLKRLEPGVDEDVEADPKAHRAWLDRVHAFVKTLDNSQNGRKLKAMEDILEFERGRGNFRPDEYRLFLDYLKLSVREKRAGAVFRHVDGMVADYLAAYSRMGYGRNSFKELVGDDDLKRIFTTAELLAGIDQSRVDLSALKESEFRALRDRVEINWFAGNPKSFAGGDDVTLDVDVKNVKKLRVAVYELDAFRAMVQLGGEIKSDIDLDGCVPTFEETRDYSDRPAILRHRERLALKTLTKPGVYVVECSGAGVSSRAVVRKGTLRASERVESCGHVFTVADERGERVESARLRLGETTFTSDDSGEIVVPFADPKSVGEQLAVVGADGLAVPLRFDRKCESYALSLDAFLPPEAIVSGREATAVLSLRLTAAGSPASLALLKSPQLDVTLTDLQGVSSIRKVEKLALADNGECVFSFVVPPNLASVSFALSGKVRNMSMDRDDDVNVSRTLTFNTLCRGRRIEQAFLRRDADGCSLELRGRNGEPIAARELHVLFTHRVFRDELQVTLQTDERGLVRLGKLADIDKVRLVAPFDATWNLAEDADVRLPGSLVLKEGETLHFRVPGLSLRAGKWPLADDKNAAVSLVALNRKGAVTRDLTNRLSVLDDGELVASALSAGDYRLYLRGLDRTVSVRVAKCVLPTSDARRLWIDGVQDARDALTNARRVIVQLQNASSDTRVHLVGRRFVPQAGLRGGELFAMLSRVTLPSAATCLPLRRPLSDYISGRDLGDKLRYILDRRNLPHRPGNMLERPSLLLNPWSVSRTRTDEHNDRAGEGWESSPVQSAGMAASRGGGAYGGANGRAILADGPTYDFLADNERVWSNRRPDEHGTVTIELPEGLDFCDFIAVATDGETTDFRRIPAHSAPTKFRDLRFRYADVGSSAARSRTYADLKSAYELIRANCGNEHLSAFEFITRWPTLSVERQRELYGEYACHELDVFLAFKDRPFFEKTVVPHLRNKRQKDFIDRWLLGDDLAAWTQPSAWRGLNAFERCLLAKRMPAVAKPIADQLRLWCEANPSQPEDLDRQLRAVLGLGDGEDEAVLMECMECAPDGAVAECKAAPCALAPQELSARGLTAGAKAWNDQGWSGQSRKIERARLIESVSAGWAPRKQMERAAKARAQVRQTYRPPEATREWVETHYYRRRQRSDSGELASNGRFWRDYAAAIVAGNDAKFLPESLSELIDAHSLAEAMVALAVVDLPFAAQENGPKLVYSERAAKGRDDGVRELTVVQRLVDVDRSTDEKRCYETEEFVAGRLYHLVTVVSNPTERRIRFNLALQIPDGAMALEGGIAGRSVTRYVEPYSSTQDVVGFYFPVSEKDVGTLAPATVTVDGEVRGAGSVFACNVVPKSTREDRTSWRWISQNGTEDQVIEYLSTANLESKDVPLAMIGWRMREDGFARRVYDTLSRRGVFDAFLWRFSLFGRYRISDFRDRVRELLMSGEIRRMLAPKLGPSFSCPLVDVEPEETDLFEYSEFWPLVNARAHALGGKATIANESLKAQYRRFLDALATRRTLSARDRVDAAVYLIAQDRVDEAQRMVAGVSSDEVETKMQLDYLRSYFAFSNLDPEEGRRIAARYADWPVKRWRERFRRVIAQADEIAGRVSDYASAVRSAASEAPSLELVAESPRGVVEAVTVKSRNVASGTLRAYRTDVEVTFSKSPFGDASVKPASSFLKPAWETAFKPAADGTASVRLPEELKGANLVLEATDGEGRVTSSLTALSGSLEVQVVTEYGQLRVRDRNGKPVSAAYVKVYAQDESGRMEKFHKDGYTDLRGAFDYASVSTDSEFRPARFAILVLHDTEGVKTLSVKAPAANGGA